MTGQHKANVRSTMDSFGWWLVLKKELAELWIGGRAMTLLVLFSLLLGIVSYLLATNSELKLIPPREMVFLTLQNTIAVGLFIGLLIGADSISGERERATLEGLLLVPTSRRQIVIGKFLAAISPWPAAFLIAAVHLYVLSPSTVIFLQGLLYGGALGSLLVIGFTGFGLLLSLWSDSNRTSLFTGLFVAVLFLIPTQFPGTAQTGFMGRLVKRINPMESVNQFMEKMLVNNRTFEEMAPWLVAPVLLAVLVLGILFWYSAPRLALDAKKASPAWFGKTRTATTVLIAVSVLAFTGIPAAHAQTTSAPRPAIEITIDVAYEEIKTSDTINFVTTVTNFGPVESTPLTVAMNIVNLGDGDPVDPEDWSPERTQAIEPMAPGTSVDLNWQITAILEGDYLAYLVVIPAPGSARETSQPVASQGLHLTVAQFTPLNPGGVLPVAAGMPVGLAVILAFQIWSRRRNIIAAYSKENGQAE